MIIRKKKYVFILIVFLAVITIGFTSINNPITLKWALGSARFIGKPIEVDSYVNGKLNEKIKVFHVDKYWNNELADYYILHSPEFHKRIEFFSVNKMDNYVGCPSSTNQRDYDIVFGFLFQSEVGSKFTPIQNDIKGFNFNPNLKINENEIILNLPSSDNKSEKDDLRLVFNN